MLVLTIHILWYEYTTLLMYGWWDSTDMERIPIDLLEGPISVHLVGIEPTDLPIMSWML